MVEFTWIKLSLFLILMLQVTGEEAAKSTTAPSTTNSTSPPPTKNNGTTGRTTTNATSGGTNHTTPNFRRGVFSDLLRWIIVSMALAALIISVVTVSMWTRTKGNKTQVTENMAMSLNPAETQFDPEGQDRTEPDAAAPYASVRFNKKTNSTVQVQSTDEGDGEAAAVTYSTVKATTSATGASADPSDLYATVNKPIRQ